MLTHAAHEFKKGDYNVICDRCGFKRKRSETKLEWDNLLVCADTCWEIRQPQDFVRGVRDMPAVPIARPDSTTVFVEGPLQPEDIT